MKKGPEAAGGFGAFFHLLLNQRLMAARGSLVMSWRLLKSIPWPRRRFCSLGVQPPVLVPEDLYSKMGRKKSTTATRARRLARSWEKLWSTTARKAAAKAAAIYWPEL